MNNPIRADDIQLLVRSADGKFATPVLLAHLLASSTKQSIKFDQDGKLVVEVPYSPPKRALLWPVSVDAPDFALASVGTFSLPSDSYLDSVVVVLNGQELWSEDYEIDISNRQLLLGEALLETDRLWIRYTQMP